MFTRNRVHTSRERNNHRNKAVVHSVLAVFFQRNLAPAMTAENGVSTYLALIFGTLLSSQGTDASFVLTLSGFPPGSFPSVLRFRLYQTVSRSDFLGAFQVPAFAFPFPAAPTLSEILSRISRPDRGLVPAHEAAGFPFWRSRKRTGAGRLDANRGAPLQVHAYERSYVAQTSTTTGRIIGLRR